MYKIYCDSHMMYKDSTLSPEYKLLSAVLTLKENAAGSLEVLIPKNNAAYGYVNKTKSTIRVFRDESEYWRGRVVDENIDFYNQKKITVEGAFAFFNDIIIPPFTFTGSIANALIELLDMYNENIEDSDRRILPGTVTVNNNIEIILTEYKSMYEVLKEYFIDQYNGGFKISFSQGDMHLDYKADGINGGQSITFGDNMLDFAKSFDYTDIVTAVLPLGPVDSETGEYMTIEGLSASGVNGLYYETGLISTYGRFEKVVQFNEAEDQYDLLAKAEDYIVNLQFANMTLEISAIDLHYLDNTISRFDLYDKVECISKPHGVNSRYMITEMSLDLVKPENSKFVLGQPTEKRISGTINKIVNEEVKNQVPAEVSNQISKIDWPEIGADIVDADVIKSDTMEAIFCYFRYMLVQFLETNFDAIDARTARSATYRRYIKIHNEIISIYEDVLSDTQVQYTDPSNKPLYWTAISGDNAYKYFTYETPDKIAKDKRPTGITDDEFRAMYAVKVYQASSSTLKATIGYSNFDQSQTLEPEIRLGAGDQNGYGKGIVRKTTDGLEIYYTSRITQLPLGIKVKDDGFYGIFGTNVERRVLLPIPYNSMADAQNDVGVIPALTAAALVAPGAIPQNGGNS